MHTYTFKYGHGNRFVSQMLPANGAKKVTVISRHEVHIFTLKYTDFTVVTKQSRVKKSPVRAMPYSLTSCSLAP